MPTSYGVVGWMCYTLRAPQCGYFVPQILNLSPSVILIYLYGLYMI